MLVDDVLTVGLNKLTVLEISDAAMEVA